jgi:hypothetical protein
MPMGLLGMSSINVGKHPLGFPARFDLKKRFESIYRSLKLSVYMLFF